MVNLGGMYTDAKRVDDAVDVLGKALEHAPQVAEV